VTLIYTGSQAELGRPGGVRVGILTGPFAIVPDAAYDWRSGTVTVSESAARALARQSLDRGSDQYGCWEITDDRSRKELERIYAMTETIPISEHLSILQKIKAALIDAGTVTGEAFDAILLSAGGKSGDVIVDRNPIETGHL